VIGTVTYDGDTKSFTDLDDFCTGMQFPSNEKAVKNGETVKSP
jgi:hypothetical protein